jgi:hypothetical protein
MGTSLHTSIRAGLTGLFLAFLIYILWKTSLRIHGFILPERHGDLVIATCGVLLWVVWFAVAQVILIAYDELNNPKISADQSK